MSLSFLKYDGHVQVSGFVCKSHQPILTANMCKCWSKSISGTLKRVVRLVAMAEMVDPGDPFDVQEALAALIVLSQKVM